MQVVNCKRDPRAALVKIIRHPYLDRAFDLIQTVKSVREEVWTVRKGPECRDQAAAIVSQHASRTSGRKAQISKTWPKGMTQFSHPFGDIL